MIEILAQISKPNPKGFTAGIVLWDDRVVETAPILAFMKKGKFTRNHVRAYCRGRGWKVEVIHQLERERPGE